MPTLYVLNGWKIQMFAVERARPHLHLVDGGNVYRFALNDFRQLDTDFRRAPAGMARKVRDWAEKNRSALEAAYAHLKRLEPPDKSLSQ